LSKGENVLVDIFGTEKNITLKEDIPFGHKFAIKEIKKVMRFSNMAKK
jgi:altronate dehydratase small subunit